MNPTFYYFAMMNFDEQVRKLNESCRLCLENNGEVDVADNKYIRGLIQDTLKMQVSYRQ